MPPTCATRQLGAPRDAGIVTPVETMYLLVLTVAAVAMLGFFGRLHAAGVETTAVAQAAARAASLAPSSVAAVQAARSTVERSPLHERCTRGARTEVRWTASPTGTWHGGAVTVSVRCTVSRAALAGIWMPGAQTFTVSDTQPVDRFRR